MIRRPPRSTRTDTLFPYTTLFRSISHPLTRAVGGPLNHVRRTCASFSYQAGSWDRKRRVVAKVDWHPGELYPRVGFIVTNLRRPAERSEEHTSELQSLMRISYAVFCLKKKKKQNSTTKTPTT